jgi:hypothetical protein
MRFRFALLAAACAVLVLTGASRASAALLIQVDKSTQRMAVSRDGQPLYLWPVSTGRRGFDTPSGTFRPFRMDRDHFSREWDDAPMPYSIFFTMKGHAIHGTNHASIGQPVSHGCVRLSVAHAAALWALVKQETMANTTVVLTGQTPERAAPLVAQQRRGLGIGAPAATGQDATTGESATTGQATGESDNEDLSTGSVPPPPGYYDGGASRYYYPARPYEQPPYEQPYNARPYFGGYDGYPYDRYGR